MASDKPSREQQSPEMAAFHSQYSALADTLSGNQSVILPFATHLYTNDIIDKTVHQNVQDSRNPPYERAVTILSAIESVKMKLLPEKTFRAVVLALRKIDLSMTANQLIEALEASGGTVPPDLAPQLSPKESKISLAGDSQLPVLEDTEPDINDLMNFVAVHIVGDKWKLLATSLEFDEAEIESIAINNQEVVLECCRDLFNTWRSKAYPPYLWSELQTKLCSPTVKLNAVAQAIAKRREEQKEMNKKYEVYQHFSPPTMAVLMEKVGSEVSDKWRGIGSELGLSPSTLSNIGRKNRDDTLKIMDVFSRWQAQLTTPITWSSVLIALSSPQVKEMKLADIICSDLKK